MRNEIEKVISELRGAAAEQQLGQLAQLFDAYADDLQAILDADPVSVTEPMTRDELVSELTRFSDLYHAQAPAAEFADLFQRAYVANNGYLVLGPTAEGSVCAKGVDHFGIGETAKDALTALLARIEARGE